jgi:ubiquinone/menaquinone biosynthesis C-methylase UbiE
MSRFSLPLFLLILLLASPGCSARPQNDLEYWEQRARKYGARSVLHLGHTLAQMDSVTRYQVDLLFPILQRHLNGTEQLLLDFGSGPGRFTPALAEMIGGRAIGVDIVQQLLDIAPRHERVEYHAIVDGRVPVPDNSVDIVWITLVLGSITQPADLQQAVREIERVLKSDGLLLMAENTQPGDDRPHQRFRSIDFYRHIFPSIPLQHETDYYDLGERISVFAGRKR